MGVHSRSLSKNKRITSRRSPSTSYYFTSYYQKIYIHISTTCTLALRKKQNDRRKLCRTCCTLHDLDIQTFACPRAECIPCSAVLFPRPDICSSDLVWRLCHAWIHTAAAARPMCNFIILQHIPQFTEFAACEII